MEDDSEGNCIRDQNSSNNDKSQNLSWGSSPGRKAFFYLSYMLVLKELNELKWERTGLEHDVSWQKTFVRIFFNNKLGMLKWNGTHLFTLRNAKCH